MERSSWNYAQSGQRTALSYTQTGYQSQQQPQPHPGSYPPSYGAGPAPFPHQPSSLQQGGAPAGSSFSASQYGPMPANFRSMNPRNGGPSTQPHSGPAPAEAPSATSRGVPGTYAYPPQQQTQPQPPPPPPPPPQQQPQPPQSTTQYRNAPSMSGPSYTTQTQNRAPPGAQPPSGYGAPNMSGPPPQGYGAAPGVPHQHEQYPGGPVQGPMPMYGQTSYYSQDSAVSARPAMVQTRSGDPNQVRNMGAPQSSMGDFQKNMASIARAAFLRADSDQNGYLDVKEFMDTLRSLNIHISYHDYLLRFSQMDVDKDGRIGEEEFIRVYIQELHRRYSPYPVPR